MLTVGFWVYLAVRPGEGHKSEQRYRQQQQERYQAELRQQAVNRKIPNG